MTTPWQSSSFMMILLINDKQNFKNNCKKFLSFYF